MNYSYEFWAWIFRPFCERVGLGEFFSFFCFFFFLSFLTLSLLSFDDLCRSSIVQYIFSGPQGGREEYE